MTYLAHVAVSPKRFHFNRDFFVVVQKGTQRGSSYLYLGRGPGQIAKHVYGSSARVSLAVFKKYLSAAVDTCSI